MAKVNPLSPGAVQALEILKAADAPMTLAEMNEGLDTPIASAHLTALKRRGLVDSEKVEIEVVTVREVNAYSATGEDYVAPEAE